MPSWNDLFLVCHPLNLQFRAYHYRRKNDTIVMLFDGEIMSLDESE
jgi:hypothetical protein